MKDELPLIGRAAMGRRDAQTDGAEDLADQAQQELKTYYVGYVDLENEQLAAILAATRGLQIFFTNQIRIDFPDKRSALQFTRFAKKHFNATPSKVRIDESHEAIADRILRVARAAILKELKEMKGDD